MILGQTVISYTYLKDDVTRSYLNRNILITFPKSKVKTLKTLEHSVKDVNTQIIEAGTLEARAPPV